MSLVCVGVGSCSGQKGGMDAAAPAFSSEIWNVFGDCGIEFEIKSGTIMCL